MSGWRATVGGTDIDRGRPLRFRFDGRELAGFAGDTLASALIASGVDVVARSFKYHRPRGVVGFGAEEPNALVQVGTGAAAEPNCRATQVRLVDGLEAFSQNRFPSLAFDVGAINDVLSPLIPAGFYYKMFKWPGRAWPLYERMIRRAAGLGKAPREADRDCYETLHRHTDLLVIGGGIAGLAAARAAAGQGLRVTLVDDGAHFGGVPCAEPVEGRDRESWVATIVAQLRADPLVTLLPSTTAIGHYDGNLVSAVEQRTGAGPRLRRHLIECGRIILAAGAFERMVQFGRNDLPGIMMAGAAHRYLLSHAVVAGRRCVLFANHDAAYQAAFALHDAGVTIAAIVDSRGRPGAEVEVRIHAAAIPLFTNHVVIRARGRGRVTGVSIAPADAMERHRRIACDLVLVSGGYSPAAQIFTHLGGALRYDPARKAMLPAGGTPALIAIGACAGAASPSDCLSMARAAALGLPVPIPAAEAMATTPPVPRERKQFVDLQNDVTVTDLRLAAREGYGRIEHAKRYTTLGMGTDQGKLVGLNGVAVLAEAQGLPIGALGNSRPRPPFVPVTLGLMAGPHVGALLAPARHTPIHRHHLDLGATMANVGSWQRPQLYRRDGESEFDAMLREAANVRAAVGVTDVSTLGKIDLHGPDVPRLLDHLYINGFASLRPGACRYGVMLREDGMVLDDGTVSRIGPDHWFMTTTTGNAERIIANIERARQIDLPGLDLSVTPVTEQWGALAIAGPRARDLLAALRPGFDCTNAALPFMRCIDGEIAGLPCRLLRVSFSGELAYEIYTGSSRLPGLWDSVLAAGRRHGIMPYGTEAMMTLRIEKGLFVPGFEADGRTTPADLGVARMIGRSRPFVGRRSLGRPAFTRPDRRQLVGLVAVDPAQAIPRGAQITAEGVRSAPAPMLGNVTSVTFSPALDRWIALALVAGGHHAHGERRMAASPLTDEWVPVEICDPVFVDPEGSRLRG